MVFATAEKLFTALTDLKLEYFKMTPPYFYTYLMSAKGNLWRLGCQAIYLNKCHLIYISAKKMFSRLFLLCFLLNLNAYKKGGFTVI
ncbi:MAG: hypothetical protein COA75_02055 [Cellvibrionales bacterium]|nr:MAG: hypothetical protein COA75_02055 [Cellvibrionales bacterium]